MKVLELLHDCGYEVVSITSDNNKVNVKLFKNVCDGNIASHISNPFHPDKNIYLLFDTVHLVKNIRNNWLNEKNKLFIFPSFTGCSNIKTTAFTNITDLYE
jgi:hypothetical protein